MEQEGWTSFQTPFGELLVKGPEVHFAPCLPEGKAATRKDFRDALGPILAEHGYLTTRVPHGMDDCFTRRLGFELTWSDENFSYYFIDRIPFSRKE